ncbi:uncharacterized protein JCM6883_000042 [Sporobolomyces salmoneus]|uniref:uncharacterized protein n=1 Tax=Sporobolomyces salmoneus TaxID=183962 RepID=UPI00317F45D4
MLTLVWKVFISSISSSTSSSSHKATQVSPCPHRERPTYPPPLPRSTPELDLRLSTRCDSCGSKVSLQVPQWISDSIEIAQTTPYRQRCDGRCQNVGGSRNRTEGLRKSVVEGTVRFAQRVRSSPLLPLLFAAMKAFVAFLIYLDARFLLRQQAVRVAEEVATGLVEIEKELGVMTNAGEGFSIGWEALVKGIIALAKSDSTSHNHPPSTSSRGYPAAPLDDFDQAYSEPISPIYSSHHRYFSTDMDESGPPTLTPPSPRHGPHYCSSSDSIPSLRRAPFSSPALRTRYQSSGSSTPFSQNFSIEAQPFSSPSSARGSHRTSSYSSGDSDSLEFGSNGFSQRLRDQSGPESVSSSPFTFPADGGGGSQSSSRLTTTMLGWADSFLSRAETLRDIHSQ